MEGIALRVNCFCSLFIFPRDQDGCPISHDVVCREMWEISRILTVCTSAPRFQGLPGESRVAHPSRILRRVGAKNLDTNVRVSHPLQRTQGMGHPEIHGASKHESRTCFFSESRTRGTGWGSVQEIRVSHHAFVWRCGKLAELDLDTAEIDRISNSRRQKAVKFPTSPHKKRGEIWGTRLGGIGRQGFSCCPIWWSKKANLDKSG
jgi:hypothetical protein